MKKTRDTLYILAMAFLMLPMLAACRTEICYDHFPIASVSLDWEKEWERDYGMAHKYNWDARNYGLEYHELKPDAASTIHMLKFKSDGSHTEHFIAPDGADIALEANSPYSFLLYNTDTEYIVISDIASLPDAKASATTRTRTTLTYINERHPGLRSTNPPDILYAAYVDRTDPLGYHQKKAMTIKMQPLVFTYLIRYEFEYGLEHVVLARGALAGMAESVSLRDARTSDNPSVVLYDCDVKSYGCEAQVKSFGVPGFPDDYYGRSAEAGVDGDNGKKFTLNLEVMLRNGKIVEFNYDIDDILEKQPRGGVITIKGIRIEDDQSEPGGSGGFDVDLNGWGNAADVDLPVGS